MKIINFIISVMFLVTGVFSVINILWNSSLNLFSLFYIWTLENIFLLIFSILWFSVSFYNDFYFWEYLKSSKKLNFYYIFLLLFIASMFWVIISSEAIWFLVSWEIMSISSYFLIVHESNKKGVLKEWTWYLIITHIGLFFILLSFLPFIIETHSTSFLKWWKAELDNVTLSISFFSALIWFGSKAGLFPFHIWLPKVHSIAPTNISAFLSGFMVKLPVLMILKFLILFVWLNSIDKVELSWFIVTLVIASVTSFIGIVYAMVETNIKKLLWYSTIENIGMIFLAISILILGMYSKSDTLITIWIFATLYHTFNHSIFKWLLFMTSGWIIARTGTWEYSRLWGLVRKIPFISMVFLIWIIAIAWIIPLSWFSSEFLIIVWLFKSVIATAWVSLKVLLLFSIVLLALTAIFSLITFTKLFWITFLWKKRDEKLEYKTINSFGEKVSYTIMILTILWLSLFPGIIYFWVSRVLNKLYSWNIFSFWNFEFHYNPLYFILWFILLFRLSYILYKKMAKKEVNSAIWNWGYVNIESKTQYSSDSFIQPLRRTFSKLYWDKKNFTRKVLDTDSIFTYKKNVDFIEYENKYNPVIENFYFKILSWINRKVFKLQSIKTWKAHNNMIYVFLTIVILILIVLFI
jgi:formate hydrogenlyase subunit 3/multisubunit Na+/H+ antiporter MnhD subunit